METTEGGQKPPRLPKDVKIENFTRDMATKLSDSEFAALGRECARLTKAIKSKEAERDLAKDEANQEIARYKSDLETVLDELNNGQRMVSVQCQRRFVYTTGNVHEVRLDTEEEISPARAMTPKERQLENGMKDPPKANGTGGSSKATDGEGDENGVVSDEYARKAKEEAEAHKGGSGADGDRPPLGTAKGARGKGGGRKKR